MKKTEESMAMEEVREWKRQCNEEVADLPDEEAFVRMVEIAVRDSAEMEGKIAELKAAGARLTFKAPAA